MSKSSSPSQRTSDQGDFEVRLISLRGDRRDAVRELRRLTGRSLGELRALLDAPPGILFRGTQQEAIELLRRATDLCVLELWSGGRPLEELQRSIAPGSLGPHVQRRVQAPRHERGVRFAVDDVEPTPDPVKLVPERELWLALAPGAVLRHCAADRSLLAGGSPDRQPLALAVQRAFDEHRRLRVTPDAVWLTIAMGFAQHVDLRPETLRSRLVRHEGRRTLPVAWKESWPDAVDAFAAQIVEDMGPGLRNLLSCDFTTSTELDRQVADVVLLSALERYYDFVLCGVCGIPEVELLGTVDDWRRIRERLDVLAEFDLEFWIAPLRPLADEWVRGASGEPDVAFWRAIYKPARAYGESEFTGWLGQLFPYLRSGERNPALGAGGPETGFAYPGLRLSQLPNGRVSGTVRTDAGFTCDLLAGLAGVEVDREGFLTPVSGWAVAERSFARLLDKLLELGFDPPLQGETLDEVRAHDLPKELVELYARTSGGTLHDGRWRLRRRADLAVDGTPLPGVAPMVTAPVTVFADIADGRRIAVGHVYLGRDSYDWWILLLHPSDHPGGDTPVIAKGVERFLERVVSEGDRPFFDEPDFVPEGRWGDRPSG